MASTIGLDSQKHLEELFYCEIARRGRLPQKLKSNILRVGVVSRVQPCQWVGGNSSCISRTPLIAESTTLHDVLNKTSDDTYTFIAPYDEMGSFRQAKTFRKAGSIYTPCWRGPFVRCAAVRTVFGRADTNRQQTTQKITFETPTYSNIGECEVQHDRSNRINPIGHSGIECLQTKIGRDKMGSKRKNRTFFTVKDLKKRAKWNNIQGGFKMRKNELISAFMSL